MDFRINRELKAFCTDFRPIRRQLRRIGASFVERKKQVDYFFHLPVDSSGGETRRLKLRTEGRRNRQLVYYYDTRATGSRISTFKLFQVSDPVIWEVLEATLGVKVIVRKQREVWRKDHVIFNLDNVEHVGRVFEVEVDAANSEDPESEVGEYKVMFGPFLGDEIQGSNEDLVLGNSQLIPSCKIARETPGS